MTPTYLATEWIHEFEDQPRFMYFELDEERYDVRRVEVFRDGRVVRIGDEIELADQPVPSMEEINATPGGEFRAWDNVRAEFEELWSTGGPAG